MLDWLFTWARPCEYRELWSVGSDVLGASGSICVNTDERISSFIVLCVISFVVASCCWIIWDALWGGP